MLHIGSKCSSTKTCSSSAHCIMALQSMFTVQEANGCQCSEAELAAPEARVLTLAEARHLIVDAIEHLQVSTSDVHSVQALSASHAVFKACVCPHIDRTSAGALQPCHKQCSMHMPSQARLYTSFAVIMFTVLESNMHQFVLHCNNVQEDDT